MFDGVVNAQPRWSSARLVPSGAVLSFHSITTPKLPAVGDAHVSLEAFQAFVSCLRRMGELVPLSEFSRRRAAGRSTSGLIAITLDDAYAALAGEFEEIVAAGWTFCFLLNACERVRDFERAAAIRDRIKSLKGRELGLVAVRSTRS